MWPSNTDARTFAATAFRPGSLSGRLLWNEDPRASRTVMSKHTPGPRLGRAEDIGELAAFLASDAAGYINGQIITVDGGVSARFPHDANMCELMGPT